MKATILVDDKPEQFETSITLEPVQYTVNGTGTEQLPTNLQLTKIKELAIYFSTELQRDAFMHMFPRTLNIRAIRLGYRVGVNQSAYHYGAQVRISEINKVTGAVNEKGSQRITRFYNKLIELFSK